jgi:hypothetical protein
MAKLDALLFWGFLSVGVLGLALAGFAFYRAFKNANFKKDPEGIRMFLWSAAGLLGLIVAGMSAAYILFPIIVHYFFR